MRLRLRLRLSRARMRAGTRLRIRWDIDDHVPGPFMAADVRDGADVDGDRTGSGGVSVRCGRRLRRPSTRSERPDLRNRALRDLAVNVRRKLAVQQRAEHAAARVALAVAADQDRRRRDVRDGDGQAAGQGWLAGLGSSLRGVERAVHRVQPLREEVRAREGLDGGRARARRNRDTAQVLERREEEGVDLRLRLRFCFCRRGWVRRRGSRVVVLLLLCPRRE